MPITPRRNLALRCTISLVLITISLSIYSTVKDTDLVPTLLKFGVPLFLAGSLADVVFSFSDVGEPTASQLQKPLPHQDHTEDQEHHPSDNVDPRPRGL